MGTVLAAIPRRALAASDEAAKLKRVPVLSPHFRHRVERRLADRRRDRAPSRPRPDLMSVAASRWRFAVMTAVDRRANDRVPLPERIAALEREIEKLSYVEEGGRRGRPRAR
jgi:hypothetical protein